MIDNNIRNTISQMFQYAHLNIRHFYNKIIDIMSHTIKITLAWELYEQKAPKIHIAQRVSVHRETIHLWSRFL